MSNDYQLLHSVLIIISIGLIAYLTYLISLIFFGLAMRVIENLILILVIIIALVIITVTVREEAKIQEKLNRILERAEGTIKREKREEMPDLLKPPIIEEHKGSLMSLFRKAMPCMPKKEKPEIDEEKLEEISRLTKEAFKLDTDVEGTKKAYIKVRDIYNSLSDEEKKSVGKEVIRITRLYNRIKKKSS